MPINPLPQGVQDLQSPEYKRWEEDLRTNIDNVSLSAGTNIQVVNGSFSGGPAIVSLADNVNFTGTESIRLPRGTTAQRPGTGSNGDTRYNLDTNTIESFVNSSWENIATESYVNNIDITTLPGYDPNENVDHTTVAIIAGNGLTGGGDITANRTLDIEADVLKGAAKSLAKVSISGGTPSLDESLNVTSITDHGAGDFSVNHTVNFATADYIWTANAYDSLGGSFVVCTDTAPTVSATRLQLKDTTTGTATDIDAFYFAAFGDQ